MILLTNAFSINMLTQDTSFRFNKLTVEEAVARLGEDFVSAVGHADTAALFAEQLGIVVPCNRITVEIDDNVKTLIVGQYKGPRLPEGCHTLPEGATIEWWSVTPIDWVEEQAFFEGRM